MNKTLFTRSVLSRPPVFNSTHGITNDKKDYISITKDQKTEGLCWAYALASTFEMNYALSSGNRLMLNPVELKNKAVPWWNKQSKSKTKQLESCLSYGNNSGYNPICVTGYLIGSGDSLIQMDGDDSYLTVKEADVIQIHTLKQLYEAIDKYGILYAALNSSELQTHTLIDSYTTSDDINHAVVITAVGHIEGRYGVYLEILNSWGYAHGYDGLQYIKIADDENSYIVNNLGVFSLVIGIDVERNPLKQYADLLWAVILAILFAISTIALVVVLVIHYRYKHKMENIQAMVPSTDTKLESILSV